MEPLYYQTPYVKEFDAIVTACRPAKHGFEVELSQTGFYPEGGGQPSDTGRIGEVHVTHVEEKHGVVVHETDALLEVGSTVHAAIDWEQRFSNMQQHTGEHIISGLIHAAYGYDNVGFHMGHDEVTVDLQDGYLTISAAKGLDKDESDKKGKFLRQERYAGSMSRSFYVGDDVESADVSAKFEDGILKISVPKAAHKELPKHTTIAIE